MIWRVTGRAAPGRTDAGAVKGSFWLYIATVLFLLTEATYGAASHSAPSNRRSVS